MRNIFFGNEEESLSLQILYALLRLQNSSGELVCVLCVCMNFLSYIITHKVPNYFLHIGR